MNKKNAPLKDFKQKGKRFVSPWNCHFGNSSVNASYTRLSIPELAWLGALNKTLGWQRGAEVAKDTVVAFEQRREKRFRLMYSYTSALELMPSEDRQEVLSTLKTSTISDLRSGLALFCEVYPRFPLGINLLQTDFTKIPSTTATDFAKELIQEIFPKRELPGIQMQSNAVYNAFISGWLKVSSGVSLANFPEIQNYPHTEESKVIGASVCSMINMWTGEIVTGNRYSWSAYFWYRGLQIEPLDYSHLEDED